MSSERYLFFYILLVHFEETIAGRKANFYLNLGLFSWLTIKSYSNVYCMSIRKLALKGVMFHKAFSSIRVEKSDAFWTVFCTHN